MLDLFSDKQFRRLFFANLLSSCGQGMTIIGIPWYLTRRFGGATEVGVLMVVSAMVAFFLSLYFGLLVDRYPRKLLLQSENIVGFVLQSSLGAIGLFIAVETWQVYVSYLMTIVLFQLHYPALYALTQESFDRKHYAHLSGLLEILGQSASVIAGAVAGQLLENPNGVALVLILDGLTYAAAFVILFPYRYRIVVGMQIVEVERALFKIRREFSETIMYFKSVPCLFTFGVSLFTAFIVLLVIDLINPIFVSQSLRETAWVYTSMESIYAVGALAAGLFARRAASAFGDKVIYISAFVLFFVVLVLNAIFPSLWMALFMMLGVGWSNAALRVSRLTVFLQIVPIAFQGRVSSFINSFGIVLRTIMLSIFTVLLTVILPETAYLWASAIIMVAFIGFWYSHKSYIDLHPTSAKSMS
jgi:MFS family permease